MSSSFYPKYRKNPRFSLNPRKDIGMAEMEADLDFGRFSKEE
jgi:hypothetical protein